MKIEFSLAKQHCQSVALLNWRVCCITAGYCVRRGYSRANEATPLAFRRIPARNLELDTVSRLSWLLDHLFTPLDRVVNVQLAISIAIDAGTVCIINLTLCCLSEASHSTKSSGLCFSTNSFVTFDRFY